LHHFPPSEKLNVLVCFGGTVLGKAEGYDNLWHGHVTAVTVAPEFRRIGLAKQLMDYLEDLSIHTYNAHFVDLFVRVSNALAIKMYEGMGYTVYRRVLGYYSGEEDAFGKKSRHCPSMIWTKASLTS
jgi:N-terminal acetyltransferase B complex catalytic subunit